MSCLTPEGIACVDHLPSRCEINRPTSYKLPPTQINGVMPQIRRGARHARRGLPRKALAFAANVCTAPWGDCHPRLRQRHFLPLDGSDSLPGGFVMHLWAPEGEAQVARVSNHRANGRGVPRAVVGPADDNIWPLSPRPVSLSLRQRYGGSHLRSVRASIFPEMHSRSCRLPRK
jgi:hypothetical protein